MLDYDSPILVNLCEAITISLKVRAAIEIPRCRIELGLKKLPFSTKPAYFLSGLTSTSRIETLGVGQELNFSFSLVPCATGRHQISCSVVSHENAWPIFPSLFFTCSET